MGVVDPTVVANFAQYTPDMRPSVPIIFFIDRNYNVRSQFMGSEPFFQSGDMTAKIRAEIDKIVAEKPPASALKASPKK